MNAGFDFAERVVVVTGAASGIGRRTVERLQAAGALCVALDRAPVETDAVERHQVDITLEESWRDVVEQTIRRFGRIDGLVNSAGIPLMGSIPDTPLADFRRVMAVNVEGTFLAMKYVMPGMLERRRGAIVNISSTAGIAGAANAGAYCASKGAVRMLSKSAALEAIAAGGSVRVNSLHPAMTDTPMVTEIVRQDGGGEDTREAMRKLQPSGRFIEPDAVVDAILFLLSDQSMRINGSELIVDDGFTAQ